MTLAYQHRQVALCQNTNHLVDHLKAMLEHFLEQETVSHHLSRLHISQRMLHQQGRLLFSSLKRAFASK